MVPNALIIQHNFCLFLVHIVNFIIPQVDVCERSHFGEG